MALYDVPAPAKLNLFLHVTGRRSDGYHELQTVFRFIDLCDTLDFDLRRDGLIQREDSSFPELLAQHDLVVRAAQALQQATGTRYGAQIRYTKRIPSGAGLGGGSSDAATTLIALNRLWGTGLDRDALMALARPLGADVPVFIFGRSAFAEGVGDVLTEITLPARSYVVLRPSGSVPTASVFADPNLTRNTESVIISVFADWQTVVAQEGANETPASTPGAGIGGNSLFGRNDLEPVVLARYEPIRNMADALRKNGFHARMTGSGSCFFVEYDTPKQAARAHQEISSKMLVGCNAVVDAAWVCPGLADHPLRHW